MVIHIRYDKIREVRVRRTVFLGHYVPQLAKAIVDYNRAHSKDHIINLKGFIVST